MIQKILITPFQRFVKIESFSGILLFAATIIAIAWANTPFSHIYESLWQYELGISIHNFELVKPVILWINDGLMAIFFFVIGLEIKRELLIGELNTMKKASTPLLAAAGGMLFPVIIFIVFNRDPEASHGWGIPMATDIAFSLAIIKLLGKRVPLSLKVFLTAFAIVDDIGAVMVIALFYSGGIKWTLLFIAIVLLGFLAVLAWRNIHSKYLILFVGIIVWVLFLKSGIHPTIAGVLLAFTVPIRQKINIKTYTSRLCDIVDDIKAADSSTPLLSGEQIEHIDNLEDWTDQVQSPLQQLEHRLHNWVAYFIMPLFALSNAGVSFTSGMNVDTALMFIIAAALVAGNFIGVSLMVFAGIKLKITQLPEDSSFKQIIGIAFLAGVGFTMSIFIANLAFADHPELMDSAKLGILLGSFISGLTGYFVLRFTGRKD